MFEDNSCISMSADQRSNLSALLPFDLKLVSVKFVGLGLALPTFSFGFCNG